MPEISSVVKVGRNGQGAGNREVIRCGTIRTRPGRKSKGRNEPRSTRAQKKVTVIM